MGGASRDSTGLGALEEVIVLCVMLRVIIESCAKGLERLNRKQ